MTEELRALMAERLSVRARSFPKAVRKAGRLLPAPARTAARELIALEPRLAHPKLAARTDPAQATRAANVIRNSLARRRPGARAGQRRSLLAAEIGFRALVVIGAGIAFVQWIGPT
ncbi:hypothetical protein [Gymnodinialimonas ceratoperidinii]|uniref:Uncharacterized protein n=1 Tax=Gymnodinialimonas ceratoperidinii TaxID=2856823 RepID=A0A8F6TYV9_9RHOB|nr:hypothetical protein [Gymnodinialimonas ceratoperidinii]QXT40699.1 hypothetical protein KYE46_05545 [Gymnodinialimonas ceratoperidinii]